MKVKIIYLSDKYAHAEPVIASKKLFESAGVVYRRLEMKKKEITINFSD